MRNGENQDDIAVSLVDQTEGELGENEPSDPAVDLRRQARVLQDAPVP